MLCHPPFPSSSSSPACCLLRVCGVLLHEGVALLCLLLQDEPEHRRADASVAEGCPSTGPCHVTVSRCTECCNAGVPVPIARSLQLYLPDARLLLRPPVICSYRSALGDMVAKTAGVISTPFRVSKSTKANQRVLVIASDGLWDFVPNDEVILIASQANDSRTAAVRGTSSVCACLRVHLRFTFIVCVCVCVCVRSNPCVFPWFAPGPTSAAYTCANGTNSLAGANHVLRRHHHYCS